MQSPNRCISPGRHSPSPDALRSGVLRAAALGLCALAAAPAAAQLDLRLSGGGFPGTIDFVVSGANPNQGCAVLVGFGPGPTPLSLVDPNDPRSVRVDQSILQVSPWGFANPMGEYRPPSWSIPNDPNLLDLALFYQGVSFPGGGMLIDDISRPVVLRVGPDDTFRSRNVFLGPGRAFGTTVPRPDGSWMVVAGGDGALLAQAALNDAEIYNPVTDRFQSGPLLLDARSLHTASLLPDGRWMFAGGVDFNNDPQTACEVWSPVTDFFTSTGAMATPRAGHTATTLPDGRILVAGGLADLNAPNTPLDPIYSAQASTEIFDPVANTWSNGPNMSTPRVGHMVLPVGNRFLFIGGVSFDRIIFINVPALRDSTEWYDPATGMFSAGPTMNDPHALCDPIDLGNNRYLVAGGFGVLSLTNPGGASAKAEIFDAGTNVWTAVPDMAVPRANAGGADLGGGRFLVFGGADGTIFNPLPLASSEIWDDVAGTWSSGPTMNSPRAAASIYATAAGQLHVIGGVSMPSGPGTGASTTNSTEWLFH